MTKIIKCRVVEWLDGRSTANMSLTAIGVCESGLEGSRRGSRKSEGALLAAVNAKLEDGNIRAAIRILCRFASFGPVSFSFIFIFGLLCFSAYPKLQQVFVSCKPSRIFCVQPLKLRRS